MRLQITRTGGPRTGLMTLARADMTALPGPGFVSPPYSGSEIFAAGIRRHHHGVEMRNTGKTLIHVRRTIDGNTTAC